MFKEADKTLSNQTPTCLAALSLLIIAVVGSIDHLTGYELGFSIFYLLPISLASWYIKGHFGLVVCAISAATWLSIDLASGHNYSNQTIPFWNTGVRFGFFVIVAILLKQMKQSLELQLTLAQTDGLTGLLNARTFKQRCESIFKLSLRNKRPVALGYFDLDGFKSVNDTLGHTVGDQVLKAVAETLTKRLRTSDIAARLGGDEFAILLPETDLAGAEVFFAGLHENLLEIAAHNQWPVGFSAGVAVFSSFESNIDEAIRCADSLMYRVKKSGKNKILFEGYGNKTNRA